jgi:hypothetical protein
MPPLRSGLSAELTRPFRRLANLPTIASAASLILTIHAFCYAQVKASSFYVQTNSLRQTEFLNDPPSTLSKQNAPVSLETLIEAFQNLGEGHGEAILQPPSVFLSPALSVMQS